MMYCAIPRAHTKEYSVCVDLCGCVYWKKGAYQNVTPEAGSCRRALDFSVQLRANPYADILSLHFLTGLSPERSLPRLSMTFTKPTVLMLFTHVRELFHSEGCKMLLTSDTLFKYFIYSVFTISCAIEV